jgi:hypothetical protein
MAKTNSSRTSKGNSVRKVVLKIAVSVALRKKKKEICYYSIHSMNLLNFMDIKMGNFPSKKEIMVNHRYSKHAYDFSVIIIIVNFAPHIYTL